MYQKVENQLKFEDFHHPFGGNLCGDNRWVEMAKLLPWDFMEEKYAANFDKNGQGAPAKPVRMALGSLIIKEKCNFSDDEIVEQIKENPYMQYFIGLPEYQKTAPFDPSMMTYFRKRLGAEVLIEVNEIICTDGTKKECEEDNNNNDQSIERHKDETANSSQMIENSEIKCTDEHGNGSENDNKSDKSTESHAGGKSNSGRLILDATCAPADIRYPTDLSLLNEAREKLEEIIDTLYEPLKGKISKPRTYRKKARRDYLRAAKSKKLRIKALYKAVGKQLRYVGRDLRSVERLFKQSSIAELDRKQKQDLGVIQKLYQQQKTMYETKTHRTPDRIVSISQPHIRPIVRGKASAETEFGAKISISLVNGYAFVEKISWDNYNEGIDLKAQVEAYYKRFGFYPETAIADQIYRNRDNINYCKAHGIRLSGPPLGRPKEEERKEQKQLERMDSKVRNGVEGKFGEGKRRYGLDRIMAKLKETSETEIMLLFLVMNLEHKLRLLFYLFWKFAIGVFRDRNKSLILEVGGVKWNL